MQVPFEISGLDEMRREFEQQERQMEPRCQKAVKAGAKVVVEALRAKAPEDTGALKQSIKAGAVKYSAADGYACEIKPVGNHPDTGEPLAKIGNILEYGRSNMPAQAWFEPTVKQAEDDALKAMRETFEKG